MCLTFPMWISEWIYLSWKKILPGLKNLLDFPCVRSSYMLTVAKNKRVITEHCHAKTGMINTCSQASERLFCFQSKSYNIPSLKYMPRLVKKDLKIIAFNDLQRQVKLKILVCGYLLKSIKFQEWNICRNAWIVFHAQTLRSPGQRGGFCFVI